MTLKRLNTVWTFVVELEFLPTRLPSEIATVGIEPPLARRSASFYANAYHLRQRLTRYLGGSLDEPWMAFSSSVMTKSPGPGIGSATLTVIACQAGRGPLDGQNWPVQLPSLGNHQTIRRHNCRDQARPG